MMLIFNSRRIKTIFLVYITLAFLTFFNSCDYIKSSSEKDNKKLSDKIYNGIRKNYLKGKLASTITYKDSLKNGPAINYYPNGKVNMEFNYKENVKHGVYLWYYENGKVYIEGSYSKGKKDGLFKMYRENGTLKSEMPWSNGLPCIGLKEFTPSGKLKPTPTIKIKEINTVKLNGKCTFHIRLSDGSKAVKFYEANVDDNNAFDAYFPEIRRNKGKATLVKYIPKGMYLMKTISIVASRKTKDENFYIIQKKINVSLENR